MEKKERSHNYIIQEQAYMDVARPPAWEKGETLHIDHNNGSPPMTFNHWFLTEVSQKEPNTLS